MARVRCQGFLDPFAMLWMLGQMLHIFEKCENSNKLQVFNGEIYCF